MSAISPSTPGVLARLQRRRGTRGRSRSLGLSGRIAAVVLSILVILALFGSFVAPHDPNLTDLGSAALGPSADYLLGTDGQGRDLLSRLMAGSRTGLLGPLLVVALATTLGLVPALIVSWRRGWSDAVVSRGYDLILGFPGVLLAILAAAVFGKNLTAAALAIGVSYAPYVYRLVRSGVFRETAKPYVAALQSQGFSPFAVLGRHILPNLGRLILAQCTILFAYATADLAAVSFLGLGVQPPDADWGAMVASGLPDLLAGRPAESLLASLMIAVTIVAATVLGNRLERPGADLAAGRFR